MPARWVSIPRLAGTASSLAGLAQMGMGAMGTVAVAALTVVGSRYVAMPMVIGLAPFAIATVLSARLLRGEPRAFESGRVEKGERRR